MTTKRKADRVWGIERNPDSPLFGKVVVGGEGQMPIILWKLPGCKAAARNVSGALRHGHRVAILAKTLRGGVTYYKVRTTVLHEKKKYPQIGWVTESLLKKAGEPSGG